MECPTAAAVQKATCHAQEGGQTLPGAGVGGGILGGFPGIQRAAGKSDLLHVNGMKGLGEGGETTRCALKAFSCSARVKLKHPSVMHGSWEGG